MTLFLIPLEEMFSNGKKGGAISIWLKEFSNFSPNYFVISKNKIGTFKIIKFKYFLLFRIIFLIPYVRRFADVLFIRLHYTEIKKFDKIIIQNSFKYINLLPNTCKVILHFHNNYAKILDHKNIENIKSRVAKVFVCSYFLKNEFLKKNIDSTVIYNGVNNNAFKLDINSKRENLIYLGRIDKNKNLLGSLFFLHKYSKNNEISLKLLIIGKPSLSIKSFIYFLHCVSYSFYINITSKLKIEFIGTVKHNQLSKYLNSSKIIISLPLYDEAFGLNIIEAQLCGCMPFINNLGGLRENNFYIEQYENVNPNDLFKKMYNDLSFDENIINYNIVKYNWDTISKSYNEIITNV
jgi:hypothetical protein